MQAYNTALFIILFSFNINKMIYTIVTIVEIVLHFILCSFLISGLFSVSAGDHIMIESNVNARIMYPIVLGIV